MRDASSSASKKAWPRSRRAPRRPCEAGKIEPRRPRSASTRAAGLFIATVERAPTAGLRAGRSGPTRGRLVAFEPGLPRARATADWSADELWRRTCNRPKPRPPSHTKSDPRRLRPSGTQKTAACRHILVCFLAYVLRKTLEGWSKQAGLGSSPTTLLEELARIQSADVVAPTTDGRTIRLRCVVQPDKAQTILLQHLGLTLPKRLRLPRGVARM